MVSMNTKKVKELTGLTDVKVSYLIKHVDALKREKTQGKAREYYFRDLVFIFIATLMREDGLGLGLINKGINVLNKKWTDPDDDPKLAGTLIRLRDHPASWVWTIQAAPFGIDEFSIGWKFETHVPGAIYYASFIANEILGAHDDQQP